MALYELVMPKMGESIIEATIIAWLKQVGDQVIEDEILLEIATDKVDSDVPSPVKGVVKQLLFEVDDVVPVGATIAIIETGDAVTPNEETTKEQKNPPAMEKKPEETISMVEEPKRPSVQIEIDTSSAITSDSIPKTSLPSTVQPNILPHSAQHIPEFKSTASYPSHMEGRWYSPLVRNIARAEGINANELLQIQGSGPGGRLTKTDIIAHASTRKQGSVQSQQPISEAPTTAYISEERIKSNPKPKHHPLENTSLFTQSDEEVIPMDRMRKLIAGYMLNSRKTSAHVTSMVEADVTRIVLWRNKIKQDYQKKYNERLTFSPIFAEAVIKALKDFPMINASIDGDNIILKKSIHLGIATAMESGNLIVPVVKNAGDLNLHGLTKQLNDLTSRARVNKLKADEIQGGTFTISNIGTFNNLIGTPIINQPELAILAIGAIQKKPVIRETDQGDIIAIRHMMFLSLSFDHRVIDGYLGGSFLNRIVHYIENFDPNREL